MTTGTETSARLRNEDIMPDPKKLTLYRTGDIHFAAYLCSLDIEMITTEETTGADGRRKLVFVFKLQSPDLARLKASYFGGHGTVKVRTYVDNLRALKSMLYV